MAKKYTAVTDMDPFDTTITTVVPDNQANYVESVELYGIELTKAMVDKCKDDDTKEFLEAVWRGAEDWVKHNNNKALSIQAQMRADWLEEAMYEKREKNSN
tara:strand:+ start:971 stop:1273 length:303 start_codon:yes stop_codon:yes gene_type:complete